MASIAISNLPRQAYETLHSQLLLGFSTLVATLGGDARALLDAVGLQVREDGEVGSEVTYPQLARLLELAAAELACPDFGLRLAREQKASESFGPLGKVMQSARTFGEALEFVVGHNYAHSLAARVWLRRAADGGRVFVGHDILVEGVPNKAQAVEQVLLLGHLGALEFTAGRARARRIHFRHQPLSPAAAYRRQFGCEVRFGQHEDGVEFSACDLAAAIVNPRGASFAEIVTSIDAQFTRRRPPLHAQTRGVIMHRLGIGECTNEEVAQVLKLHPRTLHRHLQREGTSFQRVKDEVRRDIMLYYLQQTDLEFGRIAEKLGFAEQSVMTRTCRRWLSASPTELRRGAAARPANLS